jgi:hypothetical protein
MTWPGFSFHLLSLNSLALPNLVLARLSARPYGYACSFHTSISLNPRISSLAHPFRFPF